MASLRDSEGNVKVQHREFQRLLFSMSGQHYFL